MKRNHVHIWKGDELEIKFDWMEREETIRFYFENKPIRTLLATPEDLEELAYGHVFSESLGDLESVDINQFDIKLNGNIIQEPSRIPITPSCGYCGDHRLSDELLPQVTRSVSLDFDVRTLVDELPKYQKNFHSTGGTHAAALFDSKGGFIVLKEDIGRHNAVDKVIGAAILQNLDISKCILVLTSRMSYDLVAKAVRSGIEVAVSIGAISDRSAQLARESGISLVGFTKSSKAIVVGPLFRLGL